MNAPEICSNCQQPTVAGHSLKLDEGRRFWRICCLCMAELIAQLDHAAETSAQ